MQSNTHTHCARHSGAKLLQMCISYQLGRQPAVNSEQSPSTPSPALSFSAPLPRANSFVIYVRSCLLRFAQSASHCPVLVVAVALGVVFFVGVKGREVLTYLLCTRWHFRCAISGFTVTASPTKITKITVPAQYRNIANDSHQNREGPTEAPHLTMPRPFGVIIIIIWAYSLPETIPLRFINFDKRQTNLSSIRFDDKWVTCLSIHSFDIHSAFLNRSSATLCIV